MAQAGSEDAATVWLTPKVPPLVGQLRHCLHSLRRARVVRAADGYFSPARPRRLL